MNLIGQNTPYTFTKFIQDHTGATTFAIIGLIILILLPIILFLHKIFPKKYEYKKLNEVEKDENFDDEYLDDVDDWDYYCNDLDYELENLRELNLFRRLNVIFRSIERIIFIPISFAILFLIPLIFNISDAYSNNFTYENKANITEIKDYIKIENDKLTINSLPDKYYYENKTLKTNEHHDFKIIKDDFYTDENFNVKIVDVTGQEYYISKSDFEKLTS